MYVIGCERLDDERLDVFARLTNHQLRARLESERGVLIAETRLVVERALDSGLTPVSALVEEGRLASLEALLARLPDACPVFVLPKEQMERLCGYKVTRGVLAAFERPTRPATEELLAASRRLAVLEGLVDTTNVGAVFRSAAALGADGVLLSPDCADPFTRRAVRVSMGTVFQVPWTRWEGSWPKGATDALADAGFFRLALALRDDALPLGAPELAGHDRLALLFGCEGYGLAEATLAEADACAIIPMSHDVDSLNVAASSAVAFWELFQRPSGGRQAPCGG